jgi:hypothetical protein
VQSAGIVAPVTKPYDRNHSPRRGLKRAGRRGAQRIVRNEPARILLNLFKSLPFPPIERFNHLDL